MRGDEFKFTAFCDTFIPGRMKKTCYPLPFWGIDQDSRGYSGEGPPSVLDNLM